MDNLGENARKALLRELSQLSESAVRIGKNFYTSDTIIEAFHNLTPDQKSQVWEGCEKLSEGDMIFGERFYMERATYIEQWAITDEPVFFYSFVEIPAFESTKSRMVERRPLGIDGFSRLLSFISE